MKNEFSFLTKKLEDMRLRLDLESAELLESTKSSYKNAEGKVKQVTKNRSNLLKAIKELDAHKVCKIDIFILFLLG